MAGTLDLFSEQEKKAIQTLRYWGFEVWVLAIVMEWQ